MERGYRICIVDPEGDYVQMAQRNRTVAFGDDLALPTPVAAAVEESRKASGIPHWLMIDEAHYFFQSQSPCLKYLAAPRGRFA